ncbi:twin-arginine translocase subunit TatC [Desulfotalea psychrophila]|uniref:Sec-independent protein translocase protein TatC n=1 Tax=Desulfotalea psychrophila (strain LSv54 / DSM 12343) TaxID=177439 RepID=Q6AN67_DESPS|nr:twin-arginine translocase subunit TatC [Desulfotalea psychrophila]CAG36207.1 related to Sec-independent protein translocase protein TatC [Desulfotalea psychrophila LSv54]
MGHYNLEQTIPMLERSLALFRPHHLELRKRIIRIGIAIVLCSAVAYIFSEQIARACITPLQEASPLVYKLVYTNLPEAFLAYIKLALLIGLICSMPYCIYQSWAFIAPGLTKKERSIARTVVFWSTLLFLAGGSFAFFIILPKILSYFMSYTSEAMRPLPKLGLYLTFVGRTILTFGIAFQIPFLMLMAGKANLVQARYFRQKRMYFYIAIITLSFLLCAGDLMASALLSGPLFLLYESGIFLSALFNRVKASKKDDA